MERAQGFAMQGARVVWTLGYSSTTLVQESAPYATITVYITGTTSLATIYSDNQLPPTPLANPFTANADGYWFFYAVDGRYDVRITAAHWDWTIGDLLLQDPFRWTADQNANGHWLNNLGGISLVNGSCHESIFLDPNCNLLFTGTGGNTLMSLSPQGDLSISGCLTASCIHLNNRVCAMSLSFDQYCDLEFVNGAGQAVFWVSQQGNTTVQGNLQVDGGFALNGPWLTDQNANGHALTNLGILGVQAIHMSNGTCSAQIGFDANCYLVVYGSLGVTGNLDVNGNTNLAGPLKVDGPFTLNGPWATDQNANGHSLYGLQKLEVAQIEFNNGTCQAELQFDANCNLVLYGNLATTGNLDVGGTLNAASFNQGGSPLDTGVLSVNGLKGEVTLLAGQGINVTATSQNITIGLQNLPYPGFTNFRAASKTFNTPYVNDTDHPMLVTIAVGFAAISGEIGVLALCDANPMPGTPVARFHTMVTNTAQTHSLTFVVLTGYYYYLQQPYPSSGAYIEFWSEWW